MLRQVFYHKLSQFAEFEVTGVLEEGGTSQKEGKAGESFLINNAFAGS